MIRDYVDCPYLHSPLDCYCNLFKGYRQCDKQKCEVLKLLQVNEQLNGHCDFKACEVADLLQENEKLKKQIQAVLNCRLGIIATIILLFVDIWTRGID